MIQAVSRPERFIRTTLVLAVFVVLFVPVARPVFETIESLTGGRITPAHLCLFPALILFGTIVAAGVELSFAPRCLASDLAGRTRRRHRGYAAVLAFTGAGSLLCAVPLGFWAYERWADSPSPGAGPSDCLDALFAFSAVGTLALVAAVLQMGIANRLAFRALARRRAGRATRIESEA